jgi:hypothetical protein
MLAATKPASMRCLVSEEIDQQQLDLEARVKGGKARAAALSPAERKEIARTAALSRWHSDVLRATHEGSLKIGDLQLQCAVLEDGKRVLSESSVLKAFGMTYSGSSSRAAQLGEGSPGRLPVFLAAGSLRPFIGNDLMNLLTQPIMYKPTKGGRLARGMDAALIPMVCDVWLRARDAGKLVPRQYAVAARADALMRGLAHTGIIALVDEATGYQEVRDRKALQAILDRFLSQELAAWAKRFPDEFYNELFRLRGWQWERKGSRRPVQVAKDTINLVYLRMLPDLLKELEIRNPKDDLGRRRAKHHQFFSVDAGSPALNAHIHAVITLMRAFDNWDEFKLRLDRSLPVVTRLKDLPLFSDEATATEVSQIEEQAS